MLQKKLIFILLLIFICIDFTLVLLHVFTIFTNPYIKVYINYVTWICILFLVYIGVKYLDSYIPFKPENIQPYACYKVIIKYKNSNNLKSDALPNMSIAYVQNIGIQNQNPFKGQLKFLPNNSKYWIPYEDLIFIEKISLATYKSQQ